MTSVNEGLGRVTIEAMFYGCLVVARHTGGTLEFLKMDIMVYILIMTNSYLKY